MCFSTGFQTPIHINPRELVFSFHALGIYRELSSTPWDRWVSIHQDIDSHALLSQTLTGFDGVFSWSLRYQEQGIPTWLIWWDHMDIKVKGPQVMRKSMKILENES